MPVIVLMYLFSSLDKSNLGNARALGMMKDIGSDPDGSVYALLNSLYFVAYAPFSESSRPDAFIGSQPVVPFTLLGKRTKVNLVIGIAGIVWGTAATCFAAVQNYPGAFACRFFVGLGGELGSACGIIYKTLTRLQKLDSYRSCRSTWLGGIPERISERESPFGLRWRRWGRLIISGKGL